MSLFEPIPMGGHWKSMFSEDEDLTWRILPYVFVWVVFGLIFIVCDHLRHQIVLSARVLTTPTQAWLFITLFVPDPRKPLPSEKRYTTVEATGDVSDPESLSCWHDDLARRHEAAQRQDKEFDLEKEIEPAELFMTVVVPAFNEEDRITGMLEEAINFLENAYGTTKQAQDDIIEVSEEKQTTTSANANSSTPTTRRRKVNGSVSNAPKINSNSSSHITKGWEILIIDDGSTDDTLLTVQTFSRVHILPKHPRRASGPWSHRSETAVKIPPGSIRMVSLEKNRGKGGAVTHGMRHARGEYVVFADADGASDFSDLGKLVARCQEIEDARGRGVAVGSRSHLVGSDAVVKRSRVRNFLMHGFHMLLRLMTPKKTAKIEDTQCGFKLFSRATLPYIVPHMHMDGWIFDVEMLMLAEFADIPVAEVAVGWREVVGSKLNIVKDSIGMAWGLAILRFCWLTGIYRR